MYKILYMPPARLTTGQIAQQLEVTRTTVDYWARTGKLTPVEIVNGIRLFDADDVAAFGAARALLKPTTTEAGEQ